MYAEPVPVGPDLSPGKVVVFRVHDRLGRHQGIFQMIWHVHLACTGLFSTAGLPLLPRAQTQKSRTSLRASAPGDPPHTQGLMSKTGPLPEMVFRRAMYPCLSRSQPIGEKVECGKSGRLKGQTGLYLPVRRSAGYLHALTCAKKPMGSAMVNALLAHEGRKV